MTFPDGRRCYLALRKLSEVFRGGESTISAAMDAKKAAWAIDEETLVAMRLKGIKMIGVKVKETGDIFLTTLATFHDRTKFKMLNFSGRGGSLQRFVPLEHFTKKLGTTIKI